jgi:SAM-dependent methyltransferase
VGEERARHWDTVYRQKSTDQVSWYESQPATSVRLLTAAAPPPAAVIDLGSGASLLPDALLSAGYTDITLLDVSAQALAITRERLADRADRLTYVVADLVTWEPEHAWDAWHDRAVFHFLVEPAARARYLRTVAGAVRPGGVVVLGCFASDGPTQCSGLPTARYDADQLADLFTPAFTLSRSERQEHRTPGGAVQPFTWVVLHRGVATTARGALGREE